MSREAITISMDILTCPWRLSLPPSVIAIIFISLSNVTMTRLLHAGHFASSGRYQSFYIIGVVNIYLQNIDINLGRHCELVLIT
jgi:hypothetical protein